LAEEDKTFLKSHFIKDWGPLWTLGLHTILGSQYTQTIQVIRSGKYRVSSNAAFQLNGKEIRPGEAVMLAANTPYEIIASNGELDLIMTLGESGIPTPDYNWDKKHVYSDFGSRTLFDF
jgi:hypothetical protein